jgi:flagellar basal-body rod protein FlgB
MIDGLTNSGSIPVLERLAQFAAARHRLISHNIANLSTPEFRPADVSVASFQEAIGAAIDERREAGRGASGELRPADTPQVVFRQGGVDLRPSPAGENILFHDGNDRDLERTMQDLAENFMAFRQTAELLRNRFDLLNIAIRERL